jgi:hypothetical protein
MRRLILALVLSALPMAAHAEWKKVTRQESKLLLDAPLLENGQEVYEYGGWSAQGQFESSYAAVVPASGVYPRMQVYLARLASLNYWRSGNELDEKWLKHAFGFLKDRPVEITAAAPRPGPYLRILRFMVDRTTCAAFEMRRLEDAGSVMSESDRNSISALYCAPTGMPLDNDLLHQATEGVYVRTGSTVERVLKGVSRPVPARLM